MHAQYKEEYHAYIVPFPFTKLLLTASLDQNLHENSSFTVKKI